MKRLGLIFTLTIAVAGGIATCNAAETGLSPQVSNTRGIKVTVTPQNLSQQAKTWDFEVTLETHTQDLQEDMAKSSILLVEGKQYAPIGWKGAPPGGHHRKGLLRFKAIAPQPPSVELQIRLSGEAAARNFKWMMKGASHGN